nr:putative prolyl-tRNA synthetase associated domain-containing protein 1 isoform X1 [Aotus nancymaae]
MGGDHLPDPEEQFVGQSVPATVPTGLPVPLEKVLSGIQKSRCRPSGWDCLQCPRRASSLGGAGSSCGSLLPGSAARGESFLQVFTVEEMMPHIQHLKGAHSKNLFLKDKKKKSYWLVTVLHDRQINLNELAKQLGVGSGNLRLADETAMLEKLKVGQGCATPLALFCDAGDVKFVLDSAFLEGGHEKVYFHPMTNAATMGLSPEDFLTFVKKTGHDPIILNFDKNN